MPRKISAFLILFFFFVPAVYAGNGGLPPHLKDFWAGRLSEMRGVNAGFKVSDAVTKGGIVSSDVWFVGYGGVNIHGYLARPSGARPSGVRPSGIRAVKKLPAVLLLHGYGDYGRHSWAERYARMGFMAFAIDFRGHGKSGAYPAGEEGLITAGIGNPSDYFIVGCILDAIRAMDFMETLPGVDRIYLSGSSMGGGIAMIVSAIDGRVRAISAGVPFLNNIAEGISHAGGGPYIGLRKYMARHRNEPRSSSAMATLGFVDVYNYAPYIKKPVNIGIGGADAICPKKGIESVAGRLPEGTKKRIYEVENAGHAVLKGWHDQNNKWFSEN
ncbi:MAG: alpha/beta fold hydrolase [Deltaproteobacteria bacterium]|nr:alpha/beta fold hydrolase [Deltaproteobacteria bacterium]